MVEQQKTLGISQRKLEQLTGIKQSVICRIETGKCIPQLDTLLKLIMHLKLEVIK
jgi:predicted transcriptional regulator